MMKPVYRRIILKLSGEALQGADRFGINSVALIGISKEVRAVHRLGCGIGLVVGAGNIFRGVGRDKAVLDSATADYMGMLATVINGMALQSCLEGLGVPTRLQSAFEMRQLCEPYIRRRAIRHLEKGRVVIFAGGTGNPYFTTDTAAALKAAEIGAEVVLKATKVDGVYSADPLKHPDARRYDRLTYLEMLERRLGVMDSTAVSLCMENHIPVVVFNLFSKGSLRRVVCGRGVRTIVCD